MGFAAKQLINKDVNCLLVKGGNQNMVCWICQWLSAGETDVGCSVKFYNLSIIDLCDLYRQAESLEYAALTDHIHNTVSTRLQKALPSRLAIHNIYRALPDLGKIAVHEIVLLIIKPKEFNYQPFMDLALEHKAFGKDLSEGVEAMLAKLIKRGEEYYAARRAKYLAGRKQNPRSSVQCSKCSHYGHVANKCRTKPQNRKPLGVELTDNGGGLKTCIREVKRGERTRTGLLI